LPGGCAGSYSSRRVMLLLSTWYAGWPGPRLRSRPPRSSPSPYARRRRRPYAVPRALWDKRALVKTWAMRGTLHQLPADDAGAYLALVGAVRSWPAGRRRPGSRPPKCRRSPRLLKPVAWQGYLCQGPPRSSRVTFTRPDSWSPRWRGVPEPGAAAPTVIRAYLRAHGPATIDAFDGWLTRGMSRKPMLRQWFADMGEELAEVDMEGALAYVLAEDLDDMVVQKPTRVVRLLPGSSVITCDAKLAAVPVEAAPST
jgi:winged helix DNA-binding protein